MKLVLTNSDSMLQKVIFIIFSCNVLKSKSRDIWSTSAAAETQGKMISKTIIYKFRQQNNNFPICDNT